ncbi:hypothetical protein [Oceanobacillus polygoni]|uniref:Uncharacterized protein n=1 Tax=Oceanobacillus polygoni TaxID=1235259 RepID=A0A9X0YWT5_9BACI|nr:hypothetical protein [Oceanobacillus polygoni]MBP2080118.1 hypothetical protein [Oceanobacillus polygoni]
MEKIYEIVVKEIELNQVDVIRSPEVGADVARHLVQTPSIWTNCLISEICFP